MATIPSVPFYLDFISPYTWLALMRADEFAASHGIRWQIRPIVHAALLDRECRANARRRSIHEPLARAVRFRCCLGCPRPTTWLTLGAEIRGGGAEPTMRTSADGISLNPSPEQDQWSRGRDPTRNDVSGTHVQCDSVASGSGADADPLRDRRPPPR